MTGLYPKFTGAWQNHQPMNAKTTTFAQILQENGYHTGYMGKWHLNGEEKPGFSNEERPFGFNDIKYQFNRGHWKFFEEDSSGKIYPYVWEDRGKINNITEAYSTDFLFGKAIKFIKNQTDLEKNFALVLSIPDPHGPNDVRAPYDKMFDKMNFKLPMTAVAAYRKQPASPGWSNFDSNLEDAEQIIKDTENSDVWQTKLRQYFGMVKLIDDKVGELLSALKERGDDDTIVVFTSDHGDMLGEHARFNKGKPYLTSAGVPFIIRYPRRIMKTKKIKTACSSPDFAPTILSLMDIDHSNVTFQGIDMSEDLLDSFPVKYKKQVRFLADSKQAKWAAAVDREFKLVLSKSDPPILFDLKEDPDELKNFYGTPGYIEISKELEESLSVAMTNYSFSLAVTSSDDKRAIFVDLPVCLDTKDQIPDLPYRVCKDLITNSDTNECVSSNIKSFCPDSCGLCCQDSGGFILVQGIFKSCKDIKENPSSYCDDRNISRFCRATCSKCILDSTRDMPQFITNSSSNQPIREPSSLPTSSPSSRPSNLPSDSPTIGTHAPVNTPTSIPSGKPNALPSDMLDSSPFNQRTSEPSSLPTSSPSSGTSNLPFDSTTINTRASVNTSTSTVLNKPNALPSDMPDSSPFNQRTSEPSSLPTSSSNMTRDPPFDSTTINTRASVSAATSSSLGYSIFMQLVLVMITGMVTILCA